MKLLGSCKTCGETVGETVGSEMLERANSRETVSQGSEKFCCCISSTQPEQHVVGRDD